MGTLKLNKTDEKIQTKPIENLRQTEAEKFSAQTFKTAEKLPEEENADKIALEDEGFVEEFKDLRTVNSTVYRRNDGTCRKIISCAPVRFSDEKGRIKAIKNSFTDDGEQIVNTENSFKVRFDKKEKSNKIFDLQKGKNVLTLSVSDSQKSCGHESGCKCGICSGKDDTVSVNLGDGTEIQYVSQSDRIKENILIKEKRDVYEYRFALGIGDLQVEESEGRLLLKDAATGETEFVIPAPFMYDADKKYSDKVSYEIDVNGAELLIKVVADADFINAAERKFPVTIDPQIIVDGSNESIRCETIIQTMDENESFEHYEGTLDVQETQSGEISEAYVYYTVPKIELPLGFVTSIKLRLTCYDGYGRVNANGYIVYPNNDKNVIVDIDITDEKTGVIHIKPSGQEYSYAAFYAYGINAPKFIVEYLEVADPYENKQYEGMNQPIIKQIDLTDKAEGYFYARDGGIAVSFNSFKASDFVLPLNITHVHKMGLGETDFGLNWRLNINKKLEVAADDTNNNTRFVYTDELGDKYIFSEEYYYNENNERFFVDKSKVAIAADGKLSFNDKMVYKFQSCNGYTLISQIDDFINYKYIEQRQQEIIQLEDYIKQTEPALKRYVTVDADTGEVNKKLQSLTKSDYEDLVDGITEESKYLLMTDSEAFQLKSLYDEKPPQSDQNASEDTQQESTTPKPDKKDIIKEQAKDNFEFVKSAFIKYFNKKDELELLLKQIPVNYIKDEKGLISGFNSNGELVLLCDSYGNCVYIVYDSFNRISEIYDSENTAIRFEYENGLLHSITDCIGGTVTYGYDGKKLVSVTFADGSTLNFKYQSNLMRTIESGNDLQAKLSYDGGRRLIEYKNASNNVTISKDIKRSSTSYSQTIDDYTIIYEQECTSICGQPNEREEIWFDEDGWLIQQKKISKELQSKSIQYSYKFGIGKQVKTFETTDNDAPIVTLRTYDKTDLLISEIVDWRSVSDTVKVKTETVYTYDLNNILIKEVATKFTDKSGKISSVKRITNYSYNAQGSLVLTETYVEGEELTSGKNYKQQVYDENGNVIKTVSWNSLDSSSKFYSEIVIAENGQVTAEKDETGEASAEYEYVSGTNVINSVKNANGGKIAYGRNPYNRAVTSVTQSTEDGEANCNDIVYEHGLPVEVKSGNTVIDYEYDSKRRKSKVTVNGNVQSTFNYGKYSVDAETGTVLFGDVDEVIKTDNLNSLTAKTSTYGDLDEESGRYWLGKSYYIDKKLKWNKVCNLNGFIESDVTYITDSDYLSTNYKYDAYNNISNAQTILRTRGATTPVLTENFTYNEYGELAQKTYGEAVTHTYSYTYKNNAARGLDYITFGTYKFKPLSDVNGRNTGKEIYDGTKKVAGEYISYRKVGDHATNMPSAVWYASGNDIKDSVKYTYDKCGNIVEIRVNGHITAKYSYDSLNRLVREDNKVFNKTVLYKYDSCGNITERCEYAYTSKTGEELEELKCEHYEYRYNGDVLVNYNGEEFAYNNLGSPTKYRNKTLQWQYGKYLTDFGGTTFVYDGQGRRIEKNGISFTYDTDGKLIKQSNGLEFVYDNAGAVGVIYNGEQYFYRKDVQGNITAVLDKNGVVVVNYVYDAWGNHAVVDASGNDITDTGHIGNVNPFRYRGYYYDTETGLYYLQTRYYDPELGRFISQDSVDYADPEKINGLNLYAYCANNPVMNVDPTGEIAISIIIGIIIGAIIGGTAAYSIAKNNGATGWELVGWTALGVVLGGFIGGLLGYAAPSLSSFMNAPIPLFSYATASGTAVVVSATGAQIIAGTVAVAALGGYWLSSDGRPKNNISQNKQFSDIMKHFRHNKTEAIWREIHQALHDEPPMNFKQLYEFIKNYLGL